MNTSAPSKSPLMSMTGFGRGRAETKVSIVEVEIRSLNHRFLELTLKLPRSYNQFEPELRALVSEKIKRGKLEVYVTRQPAPEAPRQNVRLNQGLFDSYIAHYTEIFSRHGKGDPASFHSSAILKILDRSEVLQSGENDETVASEKETLFGTIRGALDSLVKMRGEEGRKLASDLTQRIKDLRKTRTEIHGMAEAQPAAARERLLGRIKKLEPTITLDEARLAQEVALLSDRTDITEELVRLESHLGAFDTSLGSESNGKKLDFLAQEIAREFNTISSKAQDAAIQQKVVHAKVALEKVREQIQNIE